MVEWYKNLNRKQKLDLRQALIDGESVYKIAEIYGVSATAITNKYSDLLEQLSFKKDGSNITVGFKTEAYYTEEQALNLPTYSYEELSETEKQMYNDRENSTLE